MVFISFITTNRVKDWLGEKGGVFVDIFEFIRMHFEGVKLGIIAVNEIGQIIVFNKFAKKIHCIEENKEIIGQFINHIVKDSKISEVLACHQEVSGVKRIVGRGITVSVITFPVFHEDIFKGVIEIILDISEYEKLREDLHVIQKLNREMEIIFNSSSDGFSVTDGEGKAIRMNSAAMEFLEIEDESVVVGKSVYELEKMGLFDVSATKLAIERKKRTTVLENTKSGKKIIVTANPIFDGEGNLTLVVCNSRDITEISNLKEELYKAKKAVDFYQHELKRVKKNSGDLEYAISNSESMGRITKMADRVAGFDTTVLLLGESGVGKNLVARLIHNLSPRAGSPFIEINCSAIPHELLESELFGYEQGAFSGAQKGGKVGMVELADNGTLFLDEIAELPLPLQTKILHIINNKKFMRVGGTKEIKVDFRIIAATNRDIYKMVKSKKFREDLYYRLNVVRLEIPPLRERKEDLPNLINYYFSYFLDKYKIKKYMSQDALDYLLNYDYPGNVRELKNVIEQLIVLTEEELILPSSLPPYILGKKNVAIIGKKQDIEIKPLEIRPLKEMIEEYERKVFKDLHKRYKSSYKIAELLKISQSTANRKLRKYIK